MEESAKHIENEKTIQDIEDVLKNNNIQEYIVLYKDNEDQKMNILYRPDDIVSMTRILKDTHRQFFNELMSRIGET